MSLHEYPEPVDWTNGPYESECEECPECHGEGTIPVDHPRNHDAEETCPACGGSGCVEPDAFDESDYY